MTWTSSPPSHVGLVYPPADRRCGIFWPGDTVNFTLEKPGATAYTVRDLDGDIVSSGPIIGATVTPLEPDGGWPIGWYRMYLTGPTDDPIWGTAYGAYNFAVWEPDERFPDNVPVGTRVVAGDHFNGGDLSIRGMAAMGPFRWAAYNRNNPHRIVDGPGLENGSVIWGLPSGEPDPDPGRNGCGVPVGGIVDGVAMEVDWYVNGDPDPARPRGLFLAYPDDEADFLWVDGIAYHPKSALFDARHLYVKLEDGTTGKKITVRYPDSDTVVETADNLTTRAEVADAFADSDWLFIHYAAGEWSPSDFGPISMTGPSAYTPGNEFAEGCAAGVADYVAYWYPTISTFEGPRNEPQAWTPREAAHKTTLWAAAVHAGHPDAKAIGPGCVEPGYMLPDGWYDQFLANGGADNLDGISLHSYHFHDGVLAQGRRSVQIINDFRARHSLAGMPFWMTEGGHFDTVYGVYHPREMARRWLLELLLLEQAGIPKERASIFYDISHGFWSFPSFWEMADGSLSPLVTCLRVYSQQVWGTAYDSALAMPDGAEDLYLGDIFAGDDATVAALIADSAGLGPVVLQVSGVGSVIVVDAQGRQSVESLSALGRVTVDVCELPTYVRAAAGASFSVVSAGEFTASSRASPARSAASNGGAVATDGSSSNLSRVITAPVRTWYDTNAEYREGWYDRTTPHPLTVALTLPERSRVDHVTVWSGQAYSSSATLTDFDLQTLDADGVTWTTRRTFVDTPSSFAFASSLSNAGCFRESYWRRRKVWDVALEPVRTSGVRLLIRATSWGGEPDEDCNTVGGQGWGQPVTELLQVRVFADEVALKPFVVLANP